MKYILDPHAEFNPITDITTGDHPTATISSTTQVITTAETITHTWDHGNMRTIPGCNLPTVLFMDPTECASIQIMRARPTARPGQPIFILTITMALGLALDLRDLWRAYPMDLSLARLMQTSWTTTFGMTGTRERVGYRQLLKAMADAIN